MKKTKQDFQEARWRTKASVALVGAGGWIGAWLWVLREFGWQAVTLPQVVEALPGMAGDWRFAAVTASCAALGGWAAWALFWRARTVAGCNEPPPAGFDSPKF